MLENSKVKFSQRCHNPSGAPSKSQIIHGGIVNAAVVPLSVDLIPNEKGKVHFQEPFSMGEQFRPGCRMVEHKHHSDEIRNQTRKVAEKKSGPSGELKERERRHLPDNIRRSEESSKLTVEWQSRRHLDAGNSVEYNMESDMNRKQRIRTVDDLRNGIPVATKGDKYYREADREPGFYAKGGLIPGSSIQLRVVKKTESKTNEMSVSKSTVKPLSTISYAEKQKILNHQHEIDAIKSLNNPTSKLGQVVPSWEERTGAWLCKPEDEAD